MRDAPGSFGPQDSRQKIPESTDRQVLEQLFAYSLPKRAASALAARLLVELKSLPRVIAAPDDDLGRLDVPHAAVELLRVFRRAMIETLKRGFVNVPVVSGQALADYLHVRLAHARREELRVLFLDSKNGLIADEVMTIGTVNRTSVHVREIIKRALDLHATALILVHNHPAGDPEPSVEDIQLTHQIYGAARMVGISLHDHIIVGSAGHVSLKTMGFL